MLIIVFLVINQVPMQTALSEDPHGPFPPEELYLQDRMDMYYYINFIIHGIVIS